MKTAVLVSIPAPFDFPPRPCALAFTAIGLGLALVLGFAQGAVAQQNPVTAIDIALEPDATMLQHAKDANARLLKSFPKGFTLDETHHPHVTMLQQFVRTADLDKVFTAANAVLAKEKPTSWTLKAFKYYYIPSPPVGLAGIVVEPTEDLHRLQDELIKAVEPYTVKTGTPAAFFSEDGGRDIQKSLIDYVSHFVTIAAGKHFNPHVTIGVGTETYLNKMLAEPFDSFTFSAAGASVYQLGSFGTARKELKALPLTPWGGHENDRKLVLTPSKNDPDLTSRSATAMSDFEVKAN